MESQNQANKLIVFPHVPKTGGLSFENFLENVALISEKYHFIKDDSLLESQNAFSDRDTLKENQRELLFKELSQNKDKLVIIFGHFNITKYISLNTLIETGTFLRNPYDLIPSAYQYILRETNPLSSLWERAIINSKLSFEDFVKIYGNSQRTYLSNRSVDDFQFIGITQYFQKSLNLFKKIFNINETIHYSNENINKSRKTIHYELSDHQKKVIESYNAEDLAYYEKALHKFNSLCQEYQVFE